jgi:hypothetical protein
MTRGLDAIFFVKIIESRSENMKYKPTIQPWLKVTLTPGRPRKADFS